MELRPGIEVGDDVLISFTSRHSIRRLATFGSVLRSDFGPTALLALFPPPESAD